MGLEREHDESSYVRCCQYLKESGDSGHVCASPDANLMVIIPQYTAVYCQTSHHTDCVLYRQIPPSATENTYQCLLRALGAFLDEEPICRIILMEVPDGFLVCTHRGLHRLEPQVLHFKQETLKEHLDQLMQVKQPGGSRGRHYQGVWSRFPNGHQDFFRALGFELDESSAQNIFVDELEDSFVVTYSSPQSPGNSEWIKKVVNLGLEDVETMLNVAFDRRRQTQTASQAAVDPPGNHQEAPKD